jgi:single-stranded-DNA-specific exonuclease
MDKQMIANLEEILKKQTASRKVKTLIDIPHFSNLKNNIRAAKRILELLFDGKRMLIVGDYDTDGILATSIIYSFLQDCGFGDCVEYFIPSRIKDGYGMTPNVVIHAKKEMFDFIVTVDNGIAAVDAVKLAKENGIEVIITDHHTAPKVLPDVDIIVNPRVDGETLEYTYISGATVAWYLVAALKAELESDIDIRQYIDFVAITIVSDVMPLDDINLAFLNYGLKLIKQQKREIYKLVWNEWSIPTVNETSLGFNLVPMINAIGRIDDANLGVAMFVSSDKELIKKTYLEMKSINETRKDMTRTYVKEAEEIVSKIPDSGSAIIVRGDFHEGIVGIIAGKLAERHKKPAYVFTYSEEKGVWKGSGRSYADVHLYDLTSSASEFIAGFGGHKGAVGAAVADDKFEEFEKAIKKQAAAYDRELFVDKSSNFIDCELNDIDIDVMKMIDSYGPYGNGNKKPTFRTNARITINRVLKEGIHYKAMLNGKYVGLFFNVKDSFMMDLAVENHFSFDPVYSYNAKDKTMGIEFICNLGE